ncbi:YopX family protein [Gemella bergeri]
MLPPKIYVKDRKKVYDVECLNFDNKTVGFHDKHGFLYLFNFEEVIFMENTGFKDKNGKYIYVGYTVTLDDEYGDEYKVMRDEDELTFYLEPIPPFSITDKVIQLRKSIEYRITIIER